MRASLLFAVTLIVVLASVSFAHGQKQTERFIPIGQSPGISGKYTYIGTIGKTDPARRTVTVGAAEQTQVVQVADRTRIWLDRSKKKLTALDGGYGDLQVGRRVEVKYETPDRKGVPEWIKVESGE
ncbi:MAG TPA: hypothetical protein VI565_00125 [Burkholderiales bacterium]|nr:hypothetical protein [Burkholderiales bacterium]